MYHVVVLNACEIVRTCFIANDNKVHDQSLLLKVLLRHFSNTWKEIIHYLYTFIPYCIEAISSNRNVIYFKPFIYNETLINHTIFFF